MPLSTEKKLQISCFLHVCSLVSLNVFTNLDESFRLSENLKTKVFANSLLKA